MDLIQPTRDLLDSLRAPVLAPFLAEWPDATRRRAVPPQPASLPVLSWLGQVTAAAPPFCQHLVKAIASAAPEMTWKQTYTAAQMSTVFLDNYGWCEILVCERLACGFLL